MPTRRDRQISSTGIKNKRCRKLDHNKQGYEKDFHVGTLYVQDEYSQDSRNTRTTEFQIKLDNTDRNQHGMLPDCLFPENMPVFMEPRIPAVG